MDNIAIIDADIVAFRCAASAEAEPEEIAVLRADKLMRDILYLTESEAYVAYLTGANNFRKQIYPEYKANRKDKPKPVHLPAIRKFLQDEWNVLVSDGCEADDMLGVEQMERTNTVICSIDKDLLQIPGRHYNFVKNEWTSVEGQQGLRHFYEQLLKGDKTDNIPGIAGLGNVKAQRLLEGCETEQEMFDVCREQYDNDALMLLYGKLLWIWRKPNDIWNPVNLIGQNHLEPEEVASVESTAEMEQDTKTC